jgi:E3 ubiquitin-protein ligase UBR7
LEDFHGQLCRCAECFPKLVPHPQLREEEDTYEPPMSDDGQANGAASVGTGSIYDRGEAALNNMDRVRAIEGAMAYNHLRDKLKVFLQPFADSGQAVSAEDIKGYFEALRGDEQGIKDAANHASTAGGDGKDDTGGDKRHEQNGK